MCSHNTTLDRRVQLTARHQYGCKRFRYMLNIRSYFITDQHIAISSQSNFKWRIIQKIAWYTKLTSTNLQVKTWKMGNGLFQSGICIVQSRNFYENEKRWVIGILCTWLHQHICTLRKIIPVARQGYCCLREFWDVLDSLWITKGLKVPSNIQYKLHLSRHLNCWSLRCSWSFACRRCSN